MNFYMYDFAKSVATVEEGIHVYKDVRTTLELGGFNLLKWSCNDDLVTKNIPEGDRSDAKNKTFEAEPHTSSLLGMQWNVDNDILEVCRGADKKVPNKITQRAVLSFVASIFDLLGIFAPFTMRVRILLKTIWAKVDNSGTTKLKWKTNKKLGIRQRTNGVEKYATEKTLLWKKLQENRFAYFLRWLSGVNVYSCLCASSR